MEICNICMSPIEGELVRLKCNDTHFFCNSCIMDWYIELKGMKYKKMYDSVNEYRMRMCPICRKDGGLLPLFRLDDYVPSVHEKKLYKKKKKIEKNVVEKKMCNHELLKGKRCMRTGSEKYGWKCFQHQKVEVEIVSSKILNMEEEIEEMIQPVDETLYEEDLEGVLMNIENEWVHAIYELNELEEKIEKGELDDKSKDDFKNMIHSFMDYIYMYDDKHIQQLLKERIVSLQKKLEGIEITK